MEPQEGKMALTFRLQHLHSDPREEPKIKEERPDLENDGFVICVDPDLDKADPVLQPEAPTETAEPDGQNAQVLRRPRRDHRRNYQERWRSEYLMDYDQWRHGLVCMVCGTTLATLKLSTIKRHILQRHQASLLLTREEKEVVIASWEKHVFGQTYLPENLPVPVPDLQPMQSDLAPGAPSPSLDLTPPPPPATPSRPAGRGRPAGKRPAGKKAKGRRCLTARRARRYYQERWRSEYLMDYDGLRHGLVCMVCGSALATLKLSTIKRHILQKHQASLSLTPSQKDVVMTTWVEHLLNQSRIHLDGRGAGMARLRQSHSELRGRARLNQSHAAEAAGPPDQSPIEISDEELSPAFDQSAPGFPREEAGPMRGCWRESRGYLDLEEPGASFRQNDFGQSEAGVAGMREEPGADFLQSHAESHMLSQSQIIMDTGGAAPAPPADTLQLPGPTEPGSVLEAGCPPAGPVPGPQLPAPSLKPDPSPSPPQPSPAAKEGGRRRRYYQERWRVEHLMDYDPRCDGMVCMVCGRTLGTLTLSTIKRHILRKHPHSLEFNKAEKENILEAWSERARPQGTEVSRRTYQQCWRFDFLMDYNPWRGCLVCMVCSKSLANVALSTIKHHVLHNHPHSLRFSPAARQNILEAWSTTVSWQCLESGPPAGEEDQASPPREPEGETGEAGISEVREDDQPSPVEIEVYVEEQEHAPRDRRRLPGRDNRRNYQERWRLDYLMDFDKWRHVLVCMVCGTTLATLKLSTIKRHILQRHQASLGFTLAQKVLLAQEWDKKVAALAKMDLWGLPGGQDERPPSELGGGET
ncbi:zinc finger translocation-associated protein-like [Narcine bancroftii]|uniref:zinc finger translocation-associated protein-like n=1 Tax=Narcine bancroftii TaxID=1343680 RepID=UPI0038316779